MMIDIDESDYLPTKDDDDRMLMIKNALQSLRPIERKIWLTYTELGTYTAVAREYNVSVPTAAKYLKIIRKKIMDYLDDNRPTTD